MTSSTLHKLDQLTCPLESVTATVGQLKWLQGITRCSFHTWGRLACSSRSSDCYKSGCPVHHNLYAHCVSDIRALIKRTKRVLSLITMECFSSLVAISFEIPSLASQDASDCICFSKKLRADYNNTAPPSPSSSSSLAEIRIMIDNSTNSTHSPSFLSPQWSRRNT